MPQLPPQLENLIYLSYLPFNEAILAHDVLRGAWLLWQSPDLNPVQGYIVDNAHTNLLDGEQCVVHQTMLASRYNPTRWMTLYDYLRSLRIVIGPSPRHDRAAPAATLSTVDDGDLDDDIPDLLPCESESE